MSITHTKILLSTLLRLKRGEIPAKKSGICTNVQIMTGYNSTVQHVLRKSMEQVTKDWRHYSNDTTFPVAAPNGAKPDEAYCLEICGPLWEGEYGARRRELLDLIVDHITKELGEHYASADSGLQEHEGVE